VCVSQVESLKETGLGGYLEGIIPYVVADLKQYGLVEYCEKGEILHIEGFSNRIFSFCDQELHSIDDSYKIVIFLKKSTNSTFML
jgi:hypothetical protein